MHKLDYIRVVPRISDFNNMVEAINSIIDKLNEKIEIEEISIEKKVKDFKFFNGEEVKLPYEAHHTIKTNEEAKEIFDKYALSYKEMSPINKAIIQWKIVALRIYVEEEITEKEKKQEEMFETVESIVLPPQEEKKKTEPKKRGRKKKTRK